MLISDFLATHELHDSLLTEAELDGNLLILKIDFCFWRQTDYLKSQPETGIIRLCFNEVFGFSGLTGTIDDFSILKAEYRGNMFTLFLLDDFHDECFRLCFCSGSGSVDIAYGLS